MAELHQLSAAELLALYAAREVSPLEATRAVIAHIQAWEPHLRATYAFDPEGALAQARASETRWLRSQAQGALDGVPTLLKENIAYGFHRNMLAMKPIGVFVSVLGVLYGLVIARVVQIDAPYFAAANLLDPGLAAGLSLLVSMSLLAAWLFYFDKAAVRRIGFAYAERLFELLPSLPSTAARKRTAKASSTS